MLQPCLPWLLRDIVGHGKYATTSLEAAHKRDLYGLQILDGFGSRCSIRLSGIGGDIIGISWLGRFRMLGRFGSRCSIRLSGIRGDIIGVSRLEIIIARQCLLLCVLLLVQY